MNTSQLLKHLFYNPDNKVFKIKQYTVYPSADMYFINRTDMDGTFVISADDPYHAVELFEKFYSTSQSRKIILDNW